MKLYDQILQKCADHDSNDRFLDETFTDIGVGTVDEEQLSTTDGKPRSIESKHDETTRLDSDVRKVAVARELMPIGVWSLQRTLASEFLVDLNTRVENVGVAWATYIEKHRGDETPFTRVSANDLTQCDPDALAGAATHSESVAVSKYQLTSNAQPKRTADTTCQVSSNTTKSKVYQTDLEIGALFILPYQELLVTFKLITPLAHLDRCTGVSYNWLHARQSHVLPARNRFQRYQRLHTSDGDKAQDLAERILHHDYSADPKCAVLTLRCRCSEHRVHHVITFGMSLFQDFISGQIRFALSLKGPGHCSKFKKVLWEREAR